MRLIDKTKNLRLLCDIESGESAIIQHVKGRSSFKRRISEMGFVRGKEVTVVKNAPFRDPIEYKIMGYNVSLRRSEAALIEVVPTEESLNSESEYQGTLEFLRHEQESGIKEKTINIAFVGNPNAGKTTLYNAMTGKQEHVGNYSGVTVDAKQSVAHYNGYKLNITDLPGTYSLSPNSPDELYVRDHLLTQHPDVVINVLDASNLERNLYLTCQLIDMDIQLILALNMYDELEKKDMAFNHQHLGSMIGIPVVPTIGSKRKGIEDLFDKIIDVYENREPAVRHIHINYGTELEHSINRIQHEIWKAENYVREFSSRFLALRLIEQDSHTLKRVERYSNYKNIHKVAAQEAVRLETLCKDDTQTLITQARYGFISGALKETLQNKSEHGKLSFTERIDRLITGKFSGFPIFLLVLWIMFQSTFVLGQYPAQAIEWSIQQFGNWLGAILSPGILHDLLVDGVIGGVGGVLVFLPNIVILFFFISLMEDTGYMARVAFIMDKLMHQIGLHGKSFIPLIMGFGCNVPAIMATRTLENRNDRIMTMLIIPFMSCSARLPVYILITGAIFGAQAGSAIFIIYLIGIVISIITALLLKQTFFKAIEAPFVMELPPYRIPTLQSTLRHMWQKAKEYIRKMGGIILWASILIWFLSYFPVQSNNETQAQSSYIEQIGKTIEPAIQPLGFDWKIGVSLLTGVAAKEVVVSTMGVLYAENGENNSLTQAIQHQRFNSGARNGELVYSIPTTWALLIFILIYIPCIAVIAAIYKESGKWFWALWSVGYSCTIAWLLAFLTRQILQLFY